MSTVAFLSAVNGRAGVSDRCMCIACLFPVLFLSITAESSNCA